MMRALAAAVTPVRACLIVALGTLRYACETRDSHHGYVLDLRRSARSAPEPWFLWSSYACGTSQAVILRTSDPEAPLPPRAIELVRGAYSPLVKYFGNRLYDLSLWHAPMPLTSDDVVRFRLGRKAVDRMAIARVAGVSFDELAGRLELVAAMQRTLSRCMN